MPADSSPALCSSGLSQRQNEKCPGSIRTNITPGEALLMGKHHMDVFWWIIFVAFTLQPIVRQKMLEAARLRLIARLERKRGSRVITLIHRQETMGFLGFPIFRYIDIDDSEAILRAIKLTDPDVPIDIILHTPGGLVGASGHSAS